MTAKFKNLIGLVSSFFPVQIWRAQKGAGSFLTLDMGGVIEKKRKNGTLKEVGELHLWVYLSDWVLSRDGIEILNSSEEDEKVYEVVLNSLNGSSLVSTKENSNNRSVEFKLNNGCSLSVMANTDIYDAGDDLFVFYINDKETISYSLDKGWYI